MMKNNFILLFAIQTALGTAETLTGANVLETVDGINVGEYEGEFVTRKVDGPVATPGEEVNTKPYQSIDFKVDAAGSGALGTAVVYGPLLEACGFVRTQPVDEEVFTLDNNTISPIVTLARHVGNKKLNTIPDCRGTVSIAFGAYIQFAFKFVGDYNRPASAPNPGSLTYDNYAEPIPVNNDNTAICTLDGENIVMHDCSITPGDSVKFVNLPGQKEAKHGELFTKGSITILAKDITDKDWFPVVESHNGVATVPWVHEHGTVAGNTLNFACPTVQLSKPKESFVDGEAAYQFEMSFQAPLVITIK